MRRPRVVLFDLGGVLLPFDRERRVRAISEAFGVEAEAVRALAAGGIGERLDSGAAGEAELAAAMSDLAGRPVGEPEARSLWLSVFEPPNAELWAVVEGMRGRVGTGVLSDNPGFVREVFPTGAAFDHVFLSCEMRLCKPAAAVFERVAAEVGDSVLFIDDGPANVAASRDAGWDAILYRENAGLMAALADRGLA